VWCTPPPNPFRKNFRTSDPHHLITERERPSETPGRLVLRIGVAELSCLMKVAGIGLLVLSLWAVPAFSQKDSSMNTNSAEREVVLGGGCFWCLEAVFEKVPGVRDVVSGYAGGKVDNPTYKQVCGGDTGHAEVVRITYDPQATSLDELLYIFWQTHDPTTLNRQGADVGTQYRSVVYYQNEQEKAEIDASKTAAQKDFSSPIVTEILPLAKFYVAEENHQDYFRRNPNAPYCAIVIKPKLQKLDKVLR
jgi:peptide-methionine (S)-S-oxide reductase